VTWTFCVNHKPIFVILPLFKVYFQTQILRMVRAVRVVYRGWLRYAICNMEPWISHPRLYRFLYTLLIHFSNTFLKTEYLTGSCSWFGKTKFLYPWFSIFSVREPCQRPASATLKFSQMKSRHSATDYTMYCSHVELQTGCLPLESERFSRMPRKNTLAS